MRKWFEISKTHVDLDEILTYCVGKESTLISSNDDLLYFIKLKEWLYMPLIMANLKEVDKIYMSTDTNWIKNETEI